MNTCISEATVEKSRCKELPGYFLKNLFFVKNRKACRKKSAAIACGTCRLWAGLNLQSIHIWAAYNSQHQSGTHVAGNRMSQRKSTTMTSGYSSARPLILRRPLRMRHERTISDTPIHQHRHHSKYITRSTTVQSTRSQQSQPHDRMEGSAAAGGRIAPLVIYPVDSGQRIFQNEQKSLTSRHEYNRKE